MHRTPRSSIVVGLGVALAWAGIAAFAGPLDPPAGPVLPSNKTLQEVQPRIAINATNTPGTGNSLFRINQRGSYYLTGNITAVTGKHGISIGVSGVTIDLNGFTLQGIAGMGAFDGITVDTASLTDIAIVNGSAIGWGGSGIDLLSGSVANARIEGVTATSNIADGIGVGVDSVVARCAASFNAHWGIATSNGCTVSHCTAFNNTDSGIALGNACSVSFCSSTSNPGNGFNASANCTFASCAATSNGVAGFVAGDGSVVNHCTATSNQTGINVFNNGTIADSTATSNSQQGISVSAGCTVSRCSAMSNSGSGIRTSAGCIIENCALRSNVSDGITASSQCIIRDNTCSGNGASTGDGAGIHVTGNHNRIEGNNCTNADRGIDVDVGGNWIVRNTCSTNTIDWDMAANNVYGPIIDRRVPTSAAVTGFTGPGSLGTTDPSANYSY